MKLNAEDASHKSDLEIKFVPIFIVGTDRSGSTMFYLMVNEHTRIHIPKESWFLAELIKRFNTKSTMAPSEISSAFELVTNHWRWKEWELEESELKNSIDKLDEPTLAEFIDCVFQQSVRKHKKKRWGDKTPGYVTEISAISDIFPNAKFIHIIRDGRDVALSLKKTKWKGELIWEIASYWDKAVSNGCATGRMLGAHRYMEISYESLVSEPKSVLTNVFEFLGEEFEEQCLHFYQNAESHMPNRDISHLSKTMRPPSKKDIYRWKTEMNKVQLFVFESIAGKSLTKVGYARYFPGWILLFGWLFKTVNEVNERTFKIRKKLNLNFSFIKRLL